MPAFLWQWNSPVGILYWDWTIAGSLEERVVILPITADPPTGECCGWLSKHSKKVGDHLMASPPGNTLQAYPLLMDYNRIFDVFTNRYFGCLLLLFQQIRKDKISTPLLKEFLQAMVGDQCSEEHTFFLALYVLLVFNILTCNCFHPCICITHGTCVPDLAWSLKPADMLTSYCTHWPFL